MVKKIIERKDVVRSKEESVEKKEKPKENQGLTITPKHTGKGEECEATWNDDGSRLHTRRRDKEHDKLRQNDRVTTLGGRICKKEKIFFG